MMRPYAVTMIARKDNHGVLPQSQPINSINNLTNLGIYFLYQPKVKTTVTPPIIRRIVAGRISRIIQCLLIVDDIGIIRITGKIKR